MTTSATGPTTAAYQVDTQRSRALHEAASRLLPGGTSRLVHDVSPHPLYAREGHGCYVTDVDGNRFLDFFGNASSMIHGYAHPLITEAAVKRIQNGSAFALPTEEQIELAGLIAARVGSVDRLRFMNSGSEAVAFAVKAARAHTGKPRVAKFEGLYHGSYDWVETSLDSTPSNMGAENHPASVGYALGTPASTLNEVVVLPFGDLENTAAILHEHKDAVAGVLVDVMPNQIGLVAPETQWHRGLREITRSLGLLLISDEVINFRLAFGGGQEFAGFEADLTVFGKIIGGGFPIGAVGGRAEIMSVFDASAGRPKVPHAGTFNANPVTLAAGAASLSLLTRGEIERINALGSKLRAALTESIEESGFPVHVTGAGSLFRIHLTDQHFRDYRSWRTAVAGNPTVRALQLDLYHGLLGRGVLFNVGGMGAISTPMSDTEIQMFVGAVSQTLESLHWPA